MARLLGADGTDAVHRRVDVWRRVVERRLRVRELEIQLLEEQARQAERQADLFAERREHDR